MSKILYGKKIGIMGGTFDPIHNGHLVLAEQIRTQFYLDEIVFIPVGIPAHKSSLPFATKDQRYEMTRLAIESNCYFSISDIEIKRENTTYTADTMRILKESLSTKDQLYFITGADALATLESWKDFGYLTQNLHFIGATRPGTDSAELNQKVEHFRLNHGAKIELCEITSLSISSTDIRNRTDSEQSIKYLVPQSVEEYIDQKGLYKKHHPKYGILFDHLRKSLSKNRFNHSVEVAKLSRKLAVRYGIDPIKAEFAGLCHDYAKELNNRDMLKNIQRFQLFYDPSFEKTPNLAHGEVGACLLHETHEDIDEDILDAIRWHTYGNNNMTILSKIVYIADAIEPSRRYLGVDYLRHLAWIDLDKTILSYYNLTHAHLENVKLTIHTYTQKMIKSIMEDDIK